MKLNFNIEYKTIYGEQLVLNIVDKDKTVQYHMDTEDGLHWHCHINKPRMAKGTVINYYYSMDWEGNEQRHEWLTEPHRLEITAEKANNWNLYDRWIQMPEDSYLYSSAFTDCINRRPQPVLKTSNCSKTVRLKVRAPQLRANEVLGVVGSCESLGLWDITKAVRMQEHNYNEWMVDVDAAPFFGQKVELKFVVINQNWEVASVWETGDNRCLEVPDMLDNEVSVYELDQAFFPFSNRRIAGTCIPVFSLRSEGSFGVGDFGDLKDMIDFVASTGQGILQLLPINDTTMTHTWVDSYPYSCISIFALHPQYVDLRQLPKLNDAERQAEFDQLQKELNLLPQIDYERVNDNKMEYMRLLFAQDGKSVLASEEFKTFFKQTEQWLVPYAQYCYLRDSRGTADFNQWPDHRQWDEADRKDLTNSRSKAYKEVALYYFIQFILDKQMQTAHNHAHARGVILKGDIPIGVNRYGCDVWMEPNYFNMNGQAGAPPDDFAEDGQNWGFPTYNWDAMIADGCQWWVRRFRNMQKYFDAYRIDHVLGFFRIWEIPIEHQSGLMGQFSPALAMSHEEIENYGMMFREPLFLKDHKNPELYHPRIMAWKIDDYWNQNDWERDCFGRMYNDFFYRRNNQFWYREAMKKLPRLVQATRMLVCAEDLGMVPECVQWVMDDQKILSLEIQSMPKDPRVKFGFLSRNPYRSVATISTHDMATLRQWWDEDYDRTQEYWNSMLQQQGPAPHALPGWVARDIVMQHLQCPSMLCVISLQDWLATDEQVRLADPNAERINIPANPKHYWRYRMHMSIEQLQANEDLKQNIRNMINQSGR